MFEDCHSPILGKLRNPAPTRLAAFEDDRLGELDTSWYILRSKLANLLHGVSRD